jgi:Icc-related predicted phosphoesterase
MPGSFQYEDRAGAEGKGILAFFQNVHSLGAERWLEAIYKRVPRDTEILLTHTPPYGILDRASRGTHAGCQTLSATLEELGQCRMHVFGHIHEAHGAIIHEGGERVSVNAAMAGGYGQAVIVDLKHITNIT